MWVIEVRRSTETRWISTLHFRNTEPEALAKMVELKFKFPERDYRVVKIKIIK